MKTLNDFFDNIYCVNLAHRTDRWEDSSKLFAEHSLIVERFEAVNGKEVFQPGLNRHAGAYGLVLTHIKIFEDAILKKYKSILIFEDDIIFVNDIEKKFGNKIDYLPNDWGFLYLGGNNQFTRGNFEMITGNSAEKISSSNYNHFNYELVRTRWTQSTYAIGFNGNILPDVLQRLKNFKDPVDVLYPLLANDDTYKAFVFLPTLVKPKPGFSDIIGIYCDYSEGDANNF